jgi:hypothetical protein
MRELEVKIDPYTQEKFFPKRSNQVFATPQNKMMFHNERAKEYRDETKGFRNGLDRNYRMVCALLNGNFFARAHVEYLFGMGFDFGALSAEKQTKDDYCIYVYDIVMRLEGDYFIISRAEDENNGFLA